MTTIPNAQVRGFGTQPNGMPSGQDFYISVSGGGFGKRLNERNNLLELPAMTYLYSLSTYVAN